ncbi:hypothetical protein KIN20_033561 [Parelaphostrongylus tenuis]|uniref:Uncharacterized protein n=1 Tax=Parelaphostrongylus tenuis TaxID=148309 RepID=A0AAD5WIW5_PARTN|nr:hypothetical protein KIN20_033561 [Parelaphostrongylus tenuis]
MLIYHVRLLAKLPKQLKLTQIECEELDKAKIATTEGLTAATFVESRRRVGERASTLNYMASILERTLYEIAIARDSAQLRSAEEEYEGYPNPEEAIVIAYTYSSIFRTRIVVFNC